MIFVTDIADGAILVANGAILVCRWYDFLLLAMPMVQF
jgi:hypothetical protein